MPFFGYLVLLLSVVAATFTLALAVVGHHRRDARLTTAAQYGVFIVFGLLSVASFALIYLFVADDYSVKYVHRYSDRSMPLFYKATAFWGGQDGSLLFWVWVMSIWSAVAVALNRRRHAAIMPYTIVTMMVVTLFFTVMMAFVANPFETFVTAAPADGRGLNPLLQNPYMVIHPPSLYLGYIGWTIPFCFAIGALVHGRLGYEWIDAMRRWCLAAWLFLTIGLVLGGLWAYEELGWGGYWAWDPVENAAFFPWLTGTAFIHSIQVQERRQMFKIWNLVLIILTFALTLTGTMMTRSGIVQSVHAFAQSDIGTFFLPFIAGALLISFVLVIWRMNRLQSENRLESIFSREVVFLVNNWILVLMAFAVLTGTLYPAVFKWLFSEEIHVGPSFYNKYMGPLGLTLLFLTGAGPLLPWRRSSGKALMNQFVVPLSVLVLAAAGLWLAGAKEPWSLTDFSLCAFVTAAIAQEMVLGTRARMRSGKEGVFVAFSTLLLRARRRYGGYIVHFGMVLAFLAFGGNAYKLEDEVRLAKGERARIGDYDVRFDSFDFADDGQKTMVTAHVSVFEAGTEVQLGTLAPAKWAYRKPEEQVTTEVDKRLSVKDDLYVVLGGYDARSESVALQLKVNPLVNFLWLGTTVMLAGWALAIWPTSRKRKQNGLPLSLRFGSMGLGVWMGVVLILGAALAFV